jgi:hypothetical protein
MFGRHVVAVVSLISFNPRKSLSFGVEAQHCLANATTNNLDFEARTATGHPPYRSSSSGLLREGNSSLSALVPSYLYAVRQDPHVRT